MEATLLLANSAEATASGTVSALGLGWSVTSTPTPASAIVILIKVPWDQSNMKHRLHLQLVDGDGNPVMLGREVTNEDPAPLEIFGEFETGRPPGLPHGTALDQAMPISVGAGIELIPGTVYQWRLRIDDVDVAAQSFLVRPSG